MKSRFILYTDFYDVIKDFTDELPLEYVVELNRLLKMDIK